MNKFFLHLGMTATAVTACVLVSESAHAIDLTQSASSVINFSSQWSSTGWSAAQALGEPDTFAYGDISSAWAPRPANGTMEFITLGFSTPVFANGATIRETYGNGFVRRIDAVDTNDVFHTVWTGTDPSLPGSPVDFFASWATTSFLVDGLKIYVDTNHNLSAWEEIDAVKLHGTTIAPTAVPTPALLPGLIGMGAAAVARKRKQEPETSA